LNLRPSGYEPDELPGCSTPRQRIWRRVAREEDCGPGGDRLFRTLRCSTIGAEGFHGRVRDGIGCLAPRYGHQAGNSIPRRAARWGAARTGVCHVNGVTEVSVEAALFPRARGKRVLPLCAAVWIKANRAISTGQLNGLLRFHLRPIDVVVFHGSRRDLVLRRVSRLDAFSGYPVRT
jgi:hypothetical protein